MVSIQVEAPEEPVDSPDSPTPSGSGGGGEETLSLAVGDVVDIFACPQGDVERLGDRIDTLGKKISTLVIARGTVAAFGPGKSLNEKPMVLPSDVYELYIDFVVHTPEGGLQPRWSGYSHTTWAWWTSSWWRSNTAPAQTPKR